MVDAGGTAAHESRALDGFARSARARLRVSEIRALHAARRPRAADALARANAAQLRGFPEERRPRSPRPDAVVRLRESAHRAHTFRRSRARPRSARALRTPGAGAIRPRRADARD